MCHSFTAIHRKQPVRLLWSEPPTQGILIPNDTASDKLWESGVEVLKADVEVTELGSFLGQRRPTASHYCKPTGKHIIVWVFTSRIKTDMVFGDHPHSCPIPSPYENPYHFCLTLNLNRFSKFFITQRATFLTHAVDFGSHFFAICEQIMTPSTRAMADLYSALQYPIETPHVMLFILKKISPKSDYNTFSRWIFPFLFLITKNIGPSKLNHCHIFPLNTLASAISRTQCGRVFHTAGPRLQSIA